MARATRIAAFAMLLVVYAYVPARISAAPGQTDASGGTREAAQPTAAAESARTRTNSIYLVQMIDAPASSYIGGAAGLRRTKPARGQKLDADSADVQAYAAYLSARHDETLGRVGGRRKLYDYQYIFNGFAAELTPDQAAALKRAPGVLDVTKDTLRFADTSSTPAFLGLDAPDGLWARTGLEHAGEDIVIGVIDSGVWPESLSFSDRVDKATGAPSEDGKLVYHHLRGWRGSCRNGEAFRVSLCNNKLIGARRFNEAWGGDEELEAERPWEFMSARDYNGHGTHTASTAGGNHGVPPTGPSAVFGPISGMAPRARIAAYKALWSTQDGATASGFGSDLVAAIDRAVADGVDVINYSISGSLTNFLDPVDVAFLFAADAGVFVSASAGNSGPATSTVAHPSPWVTTVAAGTHNRNGLGSVTLGTGATFDGASLATAVGPAPLINASDAGVSGADADAVRLCFAAIDNDGVAVLDPAKVTGKIVVCDRGVNGRTNKSLAVQEAGGIGMILVNTSPNSINADLHFVPTVHLADTDRAVIRAYAASAGATARINAATLVYDEPAPFTASFSSRGPLRAGGGDLLKPDIIAPGQDILAAVAPPGNSGRSFNVYSGTSMSAPHVAGLAALLKRVHPDWTPLTIKSALMTSASDVLDGPSTSASVIFRQGAGHVVPNNAVDPGLAYDSDFNDWLAFLCGTTGGVRPDVCAALVGAGYSLDPSDMNVASIAIGDLPGTQTVTRRLTNVGNARSPYTVTVSGMSGIDVEVKPAVLSIKPGKTKSFTVKFTRTAAALNTYTAGQLTWSDGTHRVRIPMVIRPVALAAPPAVFGTGGPISYPVKFGYTGAFSADARGLTPATTTEGTVTDDPDDSFSPTGHGVTAIPVTIPAGTTYARFSLFDAFVSPASDIDLYLFKGATLVASSTSGTSTEEVNVSDPAAGDYLLYIHGFAVPGTADFKLFSWLLGSAAAGNMSVTAPASAVTGKTGTIDLTFTGLAPATKYLGSIVYSGVAGMPAPTIVRVDTP